MAGLVPAIPLRQAPYVPCRDARDKPGHDEVCGSTTESRTSFVSHQGWSPCKSPVFRLYYQGICLLGAYQSLFFLRCFACYFAARGAFTGMAPLFMSSLVLDAALRGAARAGRGALSSCDNNARRSGPTRHARGRTTRLLRQLPGRPERRMLVFASRLPRTSANAHHLREDVSCSVA
jgi:hypothetical protein